MKYENFEEKIKYKFNNRALLEQALTHSSFTKERNLPRADCNERLEFLGDAFFDAIIGEELYDMLPNHKEGYLSKYRALIVCEKSLAKVGKDIGIGTLMKFGRGEKKSGGSEKDSLVADAVEALIGAVYKDSDYITVRSLVLNFFGESVKEAAAGKLKNDYKSELQEKIQSLGVSDIQYVLVDEEGPDHDKTFHCKVLVESTVRGGGRGKTKKEAEQNAAKEALLRGEKYVL